MINRTSSKVKNFSKDTVTKMKIQTMDCEKTFAKHISDKGLVPRIYKASRLNKTNNPIKHGQKIWTHFTKEDVWIANKHMKLYLTSLVIGEPQLKTKMSNTHTTTTKLDKNKGLVFLVEMQNGPAPLENKGPFLQKSNITCHRT